RAWTIACAGTAGPHTGPAVPVRRRRANRYDHPLRAGRPYRLALDAGARRPVETVSVAGADPRHAGRRAALAHGDCDRVGIGLVGAWSDPASGCTDCRVGWNSPLRRRDVRI